MLLGNLSKNQHAYNKVLDELYSKGVMTPEAYAAHQLKSSLDLGEREDKVRKFLLEFLNNITNTEVERFMEFYIALNKRGFNWEFKQLARHHLFEHTERDEVSTCCRMSKEIFEVRC